MNQFLCNDCDSRYFPDCKSTCNDYTKWREGGWIEVEKELPPVEKWLWLTNGEDVWDVALVSWATAEAIKIYLGRLKATHWQLQVRPQPPKKGDQNE